MSVSGFDVFGADPYPAYGRARAVAPVFYSPRVGAWVLTRYEDVRAALRDPALYSSANALRPLRSLDPAAVDVLRTGYPQVGGSITHDGPEQRALRALLNAALAPKRIAALEPALRRRAAELVDGFPAHGPVDLVADYAYPLALDTIAGLAGLDPDALPVLRDGSLGSSVLTFSDDGRDAQVEAAHRLVALQRVLHAHLERRRTHPRDDALGVLAAGLVPGTAPLTPEQAAVAVSAAVGLVLPGHTTSVALLANGVLRLLEDRSRWETLVAHPELVRTAGEEIARFDTPVHGFLRVTTAATRVAGTDLPAGSEVLLVYASANRDDALCERAGEFDLTRAPTPHLGFALGAHYCPGATLGRLQLDVGLGTLLERLPGLRRVDDGPIRLRRDVAMRGPVELPVHW